MLRLFKRQLMTLYIRYKGRPGAFKRAVKRAKKLHARTGRRYRVFFIGNRYQVLTRQDIQQRKHQKLWGWHVNSTNIDNLKFYDTHGLPNN